MKEDQNNNNDDRFLELGRFLGRSRGGRILISLGIATAFAWLACAAWNNRELSATVLTIGILAYGLQLAWRCLPIPHSTRVRWAQELQKAERCPASPFRIWLWVGFSIALTEFLLSDSNRPVHFTFLVVLGIFIVVGIASHILVSRFIRNEHDT